MSSRAQNPYCPESGKRRWSRVGARRAQRALQRAGGPEGHIYVCPSCGDWHVSHFPRSRVMDEAWRARSAA